MSHWLVAMRDLKKKKKKKKKSSQVICVVVVTNECRSDN